MVIILNARSSSRFSENIETTELKSYQTKTKDPYITAYLKADVLPLTFIIGDGKEYNSESRNFFNHPLNPDSNYTVLLRFFESEVNFINLKVQSIQL